MKSKIYSWLLAGAYLAWGVCLLLFIPRFQEVYAGFDILLPLLFRTMFVAGPCGCTLVTVLIGIFVALNAHKFHLRYVSLIFTIALLAWVSYTANILFTNFTRMIVIV